MDDAVRVGGRQRLGNLVDDVKRGARFEWCPGDRALGEGTPLPAAPSPEKGRPAP